MLQAGETTILCAADQRIQKEVDAYSELSIGVLHGRDQPSESYEKESEGKVYQ